MIIAAGLILQSKEDGRVLVLKRGAEGDMPATWAFAGGKAEPEDTNLEETAEREAREEMGAMPYGDVRLLMRRVKDDVDYTTFLAKVSGHPVPVLNEEHTEYMWVDPLTFAPQPDLMHPGAMTALTRLHADDGQIAQMMLLGEIASPHAFMNVVFFDLRITGTGMAFRVGLDEHVWRDPEVFLSPAFVSRCNGLPVILEHPPTSALTTDEFRKRVLGTIVAPYVKGDEVWGIAKIWDLNAAKLMVSEQLSTSPSVVFRQTDNTNEIELENGSTLSIEGKPSLLDHLAICENGVWDKGGPPVGVNIGVSDMADKPEDKGEDKLDRILAHCDSLAESHKAMGGRMDAIHSHMDSLKSRMDAMEEGMAGGAADKAKKDAEEKEKADKAKKDAEEKEEKEKADAAKADAGKKDNFGKEGGEHEKEEKEKADAAKADAIKKDAEEAAAKKDAEMDKAKADALQRSHDALLKRLDALEKGRPAEEEATFADAQAKCDAVAQLFGKRAARPMAGEVLSAYRRRLARDFQSHSKDYAKVDLNIVANDAALFDLIEGRIYADAQQVGLHPQVEGDALAEVVTTDRTGRRITTFHGKPRAWMDQFRTPARRVVKFNTQNQRG